MPLPSETLTMGVLNAVDIETMVVTYVTPYSLVGYVFRSGTECAVDLLVSANRYRKCRICMGYNILLVNLHHPPSHNAAVTTTPLPLNTIQS
jgi:hypothetical protein